MKQTDLQQIGKLLDEKLEQKLEEKLEQKLEEKLDQKLDQKLAPIQKELKQHGKMLRSLKTTQDVMLKVLDREQMQQSHRLTRVEKHIGIPPLTS